MTQRQAYSCTACGDVFDSEAALQAHNQQAHAQSQQFVCRACGETFGSQEAMRAHGQAAHPH